MKWVVEALLLSGSAIGRSALSEMGKDFIFRNYVRLAIAGAGAAITVIFVSMSSGRVGPIGTILGAALGFCYFVQKQKLEELQLFRELFADFNSRYDQMNEKLESILTGNQTEDPKLRKTLVAYFNLCAEEYLFYDEGFIHRAAWRSWCLGMLYYLKDEGIRKVWDDEVSRDSYYGLTLEEVQQGAHLLVNSPRAQERLANLTQRCFERMNEKGAPAQPGRPETL